MINKVDNSTNIAFNAQLNVKTAVNNMERLGNIQKAFAEKTRKMPNQNLTIEHMSDYKNREYTYVGKSTEQSTGIFLESSFNKMLHTLSDDEITVKMVKLFKALTELKKHDEQSVVMNNELAILRNKKNAHLKFAEHCKITDSPTLCNTFNQLAGFLSKKISVLTQKSDELDAKTTNKILKIAGKDEDVKFIAEFI